METDNEFLETVLCGDTLPEAAAAAAAVWAESAGAAAGPGMGG